MGSAFFQHVGKWGARMGHPGGLDAILTSRLASLAPTQARSGSPPLRTTHPIADSMILINANCMGSLFSSRPCNSPLSLAQISNPFLFLSLPFFLDPSRPFPDWHSISQSFSNIQSSLMCLISQDSIPAHVSFSLPGIDSLALVSPSSFT